MLLASGSTVRAASKKTGVGERTISRWLQDPAFKVEVSGLRSRLTDRTLGILSRVAAKAAITLARLLADPDGNIRARSATGILDRLLAYREHADILARLEEVEARLGETKDVD
jgi:transposase